MLPLHRVKATVFNYEEIPAGYYFKVMNEGSAPQRFWHKYKFREIARRIPKDSHVLDFGCGPGSFLHILKTERPDLTAVGVDIAGRQIAFAQENVATSDEKFSFVQVEEEKVKLPFASGTFDVVTSIEVIEHVHPYLAMQILAEARRVLKSDGKIIVTTPNYRSLWPLIEYLLEKLSPVKYHDQHISKFTPNALVKVMESSGFEVKDLNSLFVIAPFTAAISKRMAGGLHGLEKSFKHLLGSLLVVEGEKLDWLN